MDNTMNIPKVSIIIPAYNASRTILGTVESIILQNYADWELLIVDDGSSDNTESIVNKIIYESRDLKIKYYYQTNSGPGAARNLGIKHALGQYIAFLDADDLLLPASIERRVKQLDININVGAVFTDYMLDTGKELIGPISKNKNMLKRIEKAIIKKESNVYYFDQSFYWRCLLYAHHPVWTGSVMHKRVPNLFFREDIKYAEDQDYWWHLSRQVNTVYIDEPLAIYQRQNSSLTKTYSLEQYDATIKSHEKLISGEPYIIKRKLAKPFASLCFEAGYENRIHGNLKRALKYLFQSLSWYAFNVKAYKSIAAIIFIHVKEKIMKQRVE